MLRRRGRGGLRQANFPVEVMKVEEKPHEVVVSSPGVVDAFEVIRAAATMPSQGVSPKCWYSAAAV